MAKRKCDCDMDFGDLNIQLSDNVRYNFGSTKLTDILVVKDSIGEFPNVGDKQHLYLDASTGDVYTYGYTGEYYVSVGVATGDTIDGGDSASVFN